MKRFCFVCKEVQEFKIVPTLSITLNRNKALQYCLKCKTVIFAKAVEEAVTEKKGFFSREAAEVAA